MPTVNLKRAEKYAVVVTLLPRKRSKDNIACKICGRNCRSKSGLTSHNNFHRLPDAAAVLKKFICAGRVCSNASVLKHFKSKHPDQPAFIDRLKCTNFGLKYNLMQGIKIHL